MTTIGDLELLRLYVDDIDDGTHELFLQDNDLEAILDSVTDDVHAAAVKIWLMKAARVNEWYQANIDGSYLSRDQVFDHCTKMADYHKQYASGQIISVEMTNTYDESESASIEY